MVSGGGRKVSSRDFRNIWFGIGTLLVKETSTWKYRSRGSRGSRGNVCSLRWYMPRITYHVSYLYCKRKKKDKKTLEDYSYELQHTTAEHYTRKMYFCTARRANSFQRCFGSSAHLESYKTMLMEGSYWYLHQCLIRDAKATCIHTMHKREHRYMSHTYIIHI